MTCIADIIITPVLAMPTRAMNIPVTPVTNIFPVAWFQLQRMRMGTPHVSDQKRHEMPILIRNLVEKILLAQDKDHIPDRRHK